MDTSSTAGASAEQIGLQRIEALIRDLPKPALIAGLRAIRDATLAERPEPDVWIGGKDNPYMKRWWLIPRQKYPFNVYLHHFLRSDDDRALHNHPWWNASILIDGSYIEHTPEGAFTRNQGDIHFRPSPDMYHRIELINNQPVWTIFITGPKVQDWGFMCKRGFVSWQEFTGQNENNGPVTDARVLGPGCGEE